MSKKIIILRGSPRHNGNTNTVTGWVAEAAEAAGATVDSFDVSKLNMKVTGCICCIKCQMSKEFECVIDDEVTQLIKRIPEYNVIVYSSPVYFCGPTAQLKAVMDRQFCLVKIDYNTRKPVFTPTRPTTLALISTAAKGSEFGLEAMDQAFKASAQAGSSKYLSLLYANANFITPQWLKDDSIKGKAEAFGRALAA